MLRADLEQIIETAAKSGLDTNLITSAATLARARLEGPALTVNAPIHRQNADNLGAIIAMVEGLGAGRLDVAHVQYYGWAMLNRDALMPTREQAMRSIEMVAAARKRLAGRMQIDFVAPDYFAKRPALYGRMGPRQYEHHAKRQGSALRRRPEHPRPRLRKHP